MSVVKRQPTADEDLFEIWSYVAMDSILKADEGEMQSSSDCWDRKEAWYTVGDE